MPAVDSRRHSQQQQQRTSYVSSFVRWLLLKKYQYEVTFSLYMLTPTEKLIFNFILLVLISMLVTAATMYLPNHVALIYNRIWYYVHGELVHLKGSAGSEGIKTPVEMVMASETARRRMVAVDAVETVMRKLDEL